jgi:tetratricopeptide (TPR) repeat protein
MTAAARERFKEGVTYFDQKQYEKARAAFLQAYALKKHPAVLLNLAQSELRSAHERDAAKHFAAYLREATDASPAERDAAQAGLATARSSIGEVTVTAEQGSEVLVDGASEGTAPLPGPIYVDPGSHAFEAKKGDRSAKQSLTLKAGEAKELKLAFATAPAIPPASAAPVASRPSEPVPPEEPERVTTGTGKRDNFVHWLLTSPAGVISGGATVLLGLGAGGFAVAATLSYNDADDAARQIQDATIEDMVPSQGICTDPRQVLTDGGYSENVEARALKYEDACQQHVDSKEQGDTFKTITIVAGIGAGVMAATTVVLYFTTAPKNGASSGEKKPPAGPSYAVVPWVAPGEGGLSLSGRF